ncbi:reverse transcriptase family protein [Uliginosibacterium sp. H3]|uniref:RNA-directed DNA polymerase n=1 Tax=Uliginosibacterium silvisoli TaxID=3114758 RepID=A0ABU6K3D1_9RHOO|nr:reverse transcriptase family protein [Uliginosibacterium sp. H3]
MKLPRPFVESRYFQFSSLSELKKALEGMDEPSFAEMHRLDSLQLPPIANAQVLATMFGINPGIIWSFVTRPQQHYRSFSIPKGNGVRNIDAPRVALKVLQKWLSIRFQEAYSPPSHVFGFIPGSSHVKAAAIHCGAQWVFSIDVQNFFPTTPFGLVESSLASLGFNNQTSILLAQLCCLHGFLAQGAPTSPVLSNLCFGAIDAKLAEFSQKYNVRLSRYADDIVFSGIGAFPEGLKEESIGLFVGSPWCLAEGKIEFSSLPDRLKVHGLLVHGETVRLTKGYRNKLRAYSHLIQKNAIDGENLNKIKGHLIYGNYVANFHSIDEHS